MVGEHSIRRGSILGMICGVNSRENADISNENRVRIPITENLRIPGAGSSTRG